MRLWPFKYEVRQLAGGDSSVNTALGVIDAELLTGGIKADVNKTAAVEFALSMVARAFMFAEPVPAVPALTPLTMSMIARQTISLGNAVFELGVSERTTRATPDAGRRLQGRGRTGAGDLALRAQQTATLTSRRRADGGGQRRYEERFMGWRRARAVHAAIICALAWCFPTDRSRANV